MTYAGHPAAVNAAWAAIWYPAKNGGTAIFCFFKAAVSFLKLSYLAFKPAQVLAEAFGVEEGVF